MKRVALRLRPNWIAEMHYSYRWRAEVVSRPTPDYPATDAEQVTAGMYRRRAGELVMMGESGEAVSRLADHGAIEMDGYCGTWRFEPGAP